MWQAFQETRRQGTPLHPLQIYCMDQQIAKIDVPYHWQEGVELLWMRRGQLGLKIGERQYRGQAGDFFYINPREMHGMQGQSEDCRYYALVFPLSWLAFTEPDEVEEGYLRPLADHTARVVSCLPADTAARAAPLLEELIPWYDGEEPGAWLGIKGNLLRLYHILYRDNLVYPTETAGTPQAEALREMARYIQQHSAEKLTLQRMGQVFHMSPKYFGSYFQNHFDRGFSDYLTAVRIQHAKELLARTDHSMELVAHLCGFSADSYLIRIFRQTQGMTPGKYRKLFRDGSLPKDAGEERKTAAPGGAPTKE